MFFILLLMQFFYLMSVKRANCSSIVEQWNEWPVKVESSFNFTINKKYNPKSEICIKIINENSEVLSNKCVLVKKKIFVDLTTDYFVIKKEKILYDESKFSLSMSLYKKSNGHFLLMEWIEDGNRDGISLSIYKERVSLKNDWRIDVKVQVLEYDNKKPIFVDDQSFFQAGKKVKVSCSAIDGLPPAKVYVDGNLIKRFREISYDELLNQWVGYLTLKITDHNSNVSCRVKDSTQFKSYNIIVNHVTTALELSPEYNGYTMNGTTLTCRALDGYPPPIIKWDFVSAKNYSNPKLLYEIKNDKLQILPTVQMKAELEFNCSALYTNPLDSAMTTVTRSFSFIIGEKPNNINFVFPTKELILNSHRSKGYATLNIAAIGAGVAGVVIMVIAVMIVIMLCRSKPKPSRSSSTQQPVSPMYAGSLLAGSKSAIRNQAKNGHNGSNAVLIPTDSSRTANTDQNEVNYDDMPRGRRPIKVVEDPVIYSTIVGTMQPKIRPSLDLGPIDRV